MPHGKQALIFIDFPALARAHLESLEQPLTFVKLDRLIRLILQLCKHRNYTLARQIHTYLYVSDYPRSELDKDTHYLIRTIEQDKLAGVRLRGQHRPTKAIATKWKNKEQDKWNQKAILVQVPVVQVAVSIAADLIRNACRNEFDTAIVVSDDVGLLPAVHVVKAIERKSVINLFFRSRTFNERTLQCSQFIDIKDLADYTPNAQEITIAKNTNNLCSYQRQDGLQLTTEHLNRWIEQFGSSENRNIASTLLANVDFWGRRRIAETIRHCLEPILSKENPEQVGAALLGNAGDSTALVSYLNSEYFSKSKLKQPTSVETVANDNSVQTVILLDDNIGSGKQALTVFLQWFGLAEADPEAVDEWHVDPLPDNVQTWLRSKRIIIVTCLAYQEGINRLRRRLPELGINSFECLQLDLMDEKVGCFHPTSNVFPDQEECDRARELVTDIGIELLDSKDWSHERKKLNALGYGGNEGLAVFFYNTPTSTLPIFWAKGKYNGKEWFPIFQRREKN